MAKEVYPARPGAQSGGKELGPGFLPACVTKSGRAGPNTFVPHYGAGPDMFVPHYGAGKFRADILVEKRVIVENKAMKKITKQDEAQLIT